MAKAFVIDVAKCSGCYNCQLACKDEHAENDWTPYAKPQPLTGQFWCRVTDHVQGTIPKVRIHYIPGSATTAGMRPAWRRQRTEQSTAGRTAL